MIIKCSCSHTGQDKLHGAGMRVANPTTKQSVGDGKAYRCTVCKTLVKVGKDRMPLCDVKGATVSKS